jgi:outer membrane protein assembly factor BamB
MINLEDGSIDWTFSTLDLEQKKQDIITTAPLILIYAISDKKSGFYAINPSDGKLLWNYPIEGNPCYTIPDDNRSLFLSFKEKDKLINENLSLENGTKIWNNIMTVDSDKDLYLPRLFIGKDLYMILGETIMALNKTDGKLIWKNSIKDGILSYFFSGEYLWLYNYHQVISLDLNEGKIQTEFLIPEKYISVATIYNNMLFASVYDSTKQVQELVCEDIKSVRTNWTLPVGSSLKSAIYYDNNNLFFTTEKAFYKIDTNSGTVITNIVLADSLQATTLAFDIIEKRDENFLIARENNLLIISEKEKTPKINIPFGITGGFTPSYMQNKINELRLGCIPDRSKSTYNTMNLYSNMTITGFSRQYQNWVFSSTASTLAYNSNASHSERISALNRRAVRQRNRRFPCGYFTSTQQGSFFPYY